MNAAIQMPVEDIRKLCRKYDVVELSVFGSVLRDDFRADSDVDLLVTFREGVDPGPWMSRYLDLEEDLSKLLGRPVDLVVRREVERSENHIRRNHILSTAEAIFVER